MPRALLSASDKTGLVEFARALGALGYEIVSTGGTARLLGEAGLRVIPVEDVTGFPEIMDGRVKTLHPMIHAGILADLARPAHAEALRARGAAPIDLVCVNLYPFAETVAGGASRAEAIEQIDVGGPAMIRAAAKNHDRVAIVTDPAQYDEVIDDLRAHAGTASAGLRARLAVEAFEATADYDGAIADHLARLLDDGSAGAADPDEPSGGWPDVIVLELDRLRSLRYGENPHQAAAVYLDPESDGLDLASAAQLHGKPLSYNNLADAAAAVGLAEELGRLGGAAAVIVKHTNPCGAATGAGAGDALRGAHAGDALAAYGGVLACTEPVDAAAAAFLVEGRKFFEVIAAPAFEPDAVVALGARWANVRLLELPEWGAEALGPSVTLRLIPGGALVQERDDHGPDPSSWTHAAGPAPDRALLNAASAVWACVKHLTSNAIAIGGPDGSAGDGVVRLFGAGAGHMDRVTACRAAVAKAGAHARGAIAASDAFFPFDDGPRALLDAGVALLIHPGGSKRDGETFALCAERGVTCLTTGVRHFRH